MPNEAPDRKAGTSRIADFVCTAEEEVLAFLVGNFGPNGFEQSRAVTRELLERGVLLRILYHETSVVSRAVREYVEWMTEQGALVRSLPRLPIRLAVVDESRANISAFSPGPDNGGIVTTTPLLVTALTALFECYWEKSNSIAASAPLDTQTILTSAAAPISRQEQLVLTLLSQGYKDEAIAERLDMSVRTVARIITQLYDHTGSETRFELGVKATRFGWV
ncbi:MAG TPA: helix-turn-helix domain-containing protein [Actinomycetaceae bacterium]|nr:helix-turn-helix domain-containing protein [Actinomycetaceae bacterium]